MSSDPAWNTPLGPAPWHAHLSSEPGVEAVSEQPDWNALMPLPLLAFPDGDTLVYIDALPADRNKQRPSYPNTVLRTHSEKLLATNSMYFDSSIHGCKTEYVSNVDWNQSYGLVSVMSWT